MTSYEHRKLVERITALDSRPNDDAAFRKWLKAESLLQLLRENAKSPELIVYEMADYSLISSVVMKESTLQSLSKEDLLNWNGLPEPASYSFSHSERGIAQSSDGNQWGSTPLVVMREYDRQTYLDIQQDYVHVSDIYWSPKENAYWRYDENGNKLYTISITNDRSSANIDLVSFHIRPLELYLSVSNSVLLRMFDFVRRGNNFRGWSSGLTEDIHESNFLFYQQKIDEYASYTRGVQIIRSSLAEDSIDQMLRDGWHGNFAIRESIEFDTILIGHLDTAFFRPEVLLEYTTDSIKYRLEDRYLWCRNIWGIPFDTNEAGQVYVYLVDLRKMPQNEQYRWKSYNEKPKDGISQRSIEADFKAQFPSSSDSLESLQHLLTDWTAEGVPWWRLQHPDLIARLRTPRTSSQKEWGDAFMSLVNATIDGFQTAYLREQNRMRDIQFTDSDRSLVLLEKILAQKLVALRLAQNIRSKVVAHIEGKAAQALARTALQEHDSYAAHFHSVCDRIVDELTLIEQTFS